jgi:hypothetical protein
MLFGLQPQTDHASVIPTLGYLYYVRMLIERWSCLSVSVSPRFAPIPMLPCVQVFVGTSETDDGGYQSLIDVVGLASRSRDVMTSQRPTRSTVTPGKHKAQRISKPATTGHDAMSRQERSRMAHLCGITQGTWCWKYHKAPALPFKPVPRGSKSCHKNCSGVGNCNADWGLCECPAGACRRKHACSSTHVLTLTATLAVPLPHSTSASLQVHTHVDMCRVLALHMTCKPNTSIPMRCRHHQFATPAAVPGAQIPGFQLTCAAARLPACLPPPPLRLWWRGLQQGCQEALRAPPRGA